MFELDQTVTIYAWWWHAVRLYLLAAGLWYGRRVVGYVVDLVRLGRGVHG